MIIKGGGYECTECGHITPRCTFRVMRPDVEEGLIDMGWLIDAAEYQIGRRGE